MKTAADVFDGVVDCKWMLERKPRKKNECRTQSIFRFLFALPVDWPKSPFGSQFIQVSISSRGPASSTRFSIGTLTCGRNSQYIHTRCRPAMLLQHTSVRCAPTAKRIYVNAAHNTLFMNYILVRGDYKRLSRSDFFVFRLRNTNSLCLFLAQKLVLCKVTSRAHTHAA